MDEMNEKYNNQDKSIAEFLYLENRMLDFYKKLLEISNLKKEEIHKPLSNILHSSEKIFNLYERTGDEVVAEVLKYSLRIISSYSERVGKTYNKESFISEELLRIISENSKPYNRLSDGWSGWLKRELYHKNFEKEQIMDEINSSMKPILKFNSTNKKSDNSNAETCNFYHAYMVVKRYEAIIKDTNKVPSFILEEAMDDVRKSVDYMLDHTPLQNADMDNIANKRKIPIIVNSLEFLIKIYDRVLSVNTDKFKRERKRILNQKKHYTLFLNALKMDK